ncbi:hypothetical protein scyTo_0005174 [Scyliorhinus torazame]|uniref:Uncharacterized protein n=1 Tax=Scyliorhinus torazame TaxID=75743 RepID=A0A401P3E7_SCYTO|nr:hypothetical protein [Scyliorhinus torazame]
MESNADSKREMQNIVCQNLPIHIMQADVSVDRIKFTYDGAKARKKRRRKKRHFKRLKERLKELVLAQRPERKLFFRAKKQDSEFGRSSGDQLEDAVHLNM